MKDLIIDYILARLREASTWRGIIMLVGGTWAQQHPDQAEAIIPIAIAIAGSIGVFFPDKSQKNIDSDSNDYKKSVTDEQDSSKKALPLPKDSDIPPSSGWSDK